MSVSYASWVTFGDNMPCFNIGCAHHVKSPCEMCGRRMAQGVARVRSGFLTIRKSTEREVITDGGKDDNDKG
jgi:hypothetical protein